MGNSGVASNRSTTVLNEVTYSIEVIGNLIKGDDGRDWRHYHPRRGCRLLHVPSGVVVVGI
ncbi:hypothetical protein CDL15_Pgr021727 [Punica granatum]|uniref:Uncharacterized protein n=1 Tax=Punica granatum TaxID=22663 RepID=A0A218WSF0_PUNGR|nr:hypothetical protein CDL15_Pgr021727 [Punica granatum]